ncbi:hypothetical protein D3C74_477910 [compost metagenome]
MIPGVMYSFDYCLFGDDHVVSYIAECIKHDNYQDRILFEIAWRSSGPRRERISLYRKEITNIRYPMDIPSYETH